MQKGITLGKGGYSKVHLVVRNGKEYACKAVRKAPRTLKEIEITTALQSVPGVVKLYDVTEDDDHYFLLLEKCQTIETPYMKTNTRHVLKEILTVLQKVHEHDIIHNDIKLNNIMRGDNGKIRLIDFGSSLYSNDRIDHVIQTTPVYCSIETLRLETTTKSDLWSLGVMTYFLLTDMLPFDGKSINDVFKSILTDDPKFDYIKEEDARDFVSHLLNKNVLERMSAQEALQHNFIRCF